MPFGSLRHKYIVFNKYYFLNDDFTEIYFNHSLYISHGLILRDYYRNDRPGMGAKKKSGFYLPICNRKTVWMFLNRAA